MHDRHSALLDGVSGDRDYCDGYIYGICVYRTLTFIRNGIPSYLTFRTHFAFLDYDKPAILVFAENLAELFFFVFIGANTVRIIRGVNRQQEKKRYRKWR